MEQIGHTQAVNEPRPVSRGEAEDLRTSVREQVSDSRAGIFGPDSVTWKVNRESTLFLGAGRAALMQLAHPWVAAALNQHSSLRNDPLARFHNTFRVVFTMIFGTLDQALAASRYLFQLHTRVEGTIPEDVAGYAKGSHYEANEVSALLWVYATLIDSALMAYKSVLPPLSANERETYYAESKIIAALFGIPASALPVDWAEFEAYCQRMLDSNSLGVNEMSREMARSILHGKGSWVPVPQWYRDLTAAWLPERLREEFGLMYGTSQKENAANAQAWLSRIYRQLSAHLRFVGPYQQAVSRLDGRPVGALTRAVNRFWMGQPMMMFGDRGIL